MEKNYIKDYKHAECNIEGDKYYLNYNYRIIDRHKIDNLITLTKKKPMDIYKMNYIENDEVLVELKTDDHEIRDKLPYGMYYLKPHRSYIERLRNVCTDQYVDLESHNFHRLSENLNQFIQNKDFYSKFNLVYKRGYLLYGPPGNGKTMFIKQVIRKYQNQAYFIFLKGSIDWNDIASYRNCFKDSFVFFIIEELTDQTGYHTDELLEFLDGSFSWENCVIFATTNYPEKLPLNIVDRPSRFDMILKFDNPTKKMRKKFISHFLGSCSDRLVYLSKGQSIAYIKELCISYLMNGDEDLTSTLDNIKEFKRYIKNINELKEEEQYKKNTQYVC